MKSFISVAALVMFVASSAAFATEYAVDPVHSNVGFSIKHFVSKVKGIFTDFNGEFAFDEAHPEKSSAKFTIQAASVSTNNAKRDEHLKSPDFFDVGTAGHETISFVSKKVVKKGKDKFELIGDMTMRGVTKPATFLVEYNGKTKDMQGNDRVGFSATSKVNRKDFGVSWNKALDKGGFVLGDDVDVDMQIEATPKAVEKKM